MRRFVSPLLVATVLHALCPFLLDGAVRQDSDSRVSDLQRRVSELENRVASSEEAAAGAGLAVFVIGFLCGLRAQNTKRSAWLWFFLGTFFNIIALLVVLKRNADDILDSARY